jgi:protein gp37
MAERTIIAWAHHTANFWMGCQKVSDGCKHCYAERLTTNRMGMHVWGAGATRQVAKAVWQNVRKWNRAARTAGERRRCFTMSLGDVFENHPVANATRPRVWEVIRECESLDFLVLTKRPERIAGCLPADWGDGWPNVWLGTSIEDNRVVDRADHLRAVPAVVRFVSYEPALGPLDQLDLTGLHWILYGGESGPGFRPEDKQWARDMRDRCREAGISFFHKQSAAPRTEMGIELDGEVIRQYPMSALTPLRPLATMAP